VRCSECSTTSIIAGGLLLEYEKASPVTNTNDFGTQFLKKFAGNVKHAAANATALRALSAEIRKVTGANWNVFIANTTEYCEDLSGDGYEPNIYAEYAQQYTDRFAANLAMLEEECSGVMAYFMDRVPNKTITIQGTTKHKPDYSIVNFSNGGLLFEYEKKNPVTNTNDFGKAFLRLIKDTIEYKDENVRNLETLCARLDDYTKEKWTLTFANLEEFKYDLDNSDYDGGLTSAQYAKEAAKFVESLAGNLYTYRQQSDELESKFLKKCKNRTIILQRRLEEVAKQYDCDWSTTECISGELIISYTSNECMKNVSGTGQTFLCDLGGIAL